jgi:2-polyprenyl-3-methyl-5-hydroxy-6-metoxy-1,4-benzoquinol methylase
MGDDAERVRQHFDQLGVGEWDRLAATPRGRASFEVHRRMLAEWVRPGDRVLELGAGPGRFTIALAELGARVSVTDISEVQLGLNEQNVGDAGWEGAVEQRLVLDARDTDSLNREPFDACVAYGGVLSYVFEDAAPCLAGMLRSVRPEGVVLASVMSTVGTVRYFLPAILQLLDTFGREHVDHELATGDLRRTPGSHTCQMYRWREIESLVSAMPCRLLAASASNCLSLADTQTVETLESDPQHAAWFLDWEARLCREPGALDAGTHIIFAVERST